MNNAIKTMKANCKNCYKCLRVCPVKAIRLSLIHILNSLRESRTYSGGCRTNASHQRSRLDYRPRGAGPLDLYL